MGFVNALPAGHASGWFFYTIIPILKLIWPAGAACERGGRKGGKSDIDFLNNVRYNVHSSKKGGTDVTNTNITAFRKNVFDYIDQAVTYGEIINVTTKNGNAVILSEDDYRGMVETLHLAAIPGMVESIREAAAEPVGECVPYDPKERW